MRPNTPARSSGNVDRDKEASRLPNSNAPQAEDRALPIVADGWEKAKMKKKRTGIKSDGAPSPSSLSTKAIDGYREPKQGMHPRHLPDAISRLNDSHPFRYQFLCLYSILAFQSGFLVEQLYVIQFKFLSM